MASITKWMGERPQALRHQIQTDESLDMALRRGVIGASLIGIGAMAMTTMLQTGMVRRLPDPPVGNFDTKKVNSSDEAYSYGGPDSPISMTAHGVNMILAAMGGPDRARRQPWLPVAAAFVAAAQAGVAAKYLFYQMPKVDKAWCPYCIVDALAHMAAFGLTLREAGQAVIAWRDRWTSG